MTKEDFLAGKPYTTNRGAEVFKFRKSKDISDGWNGDIAIVKDIIPGNALENGFYVAQVAAIHDDAADIVGTLGGALVFGSIRFDNLTEVTNLDELIADPKKRI